MDSGIIGDVVSLDLVEAIGSIHFSHSFVRGNWHSEKEATPLVLAKTCHDLDMIQWLIGKPCKKVSSFGSLTHFCEASAPEGSPWHDAAARRGVGAFLLETLSAAGFFC